MTDDTNNDEATQNRHPCEDLDYHALYRTLLRAASKLADNDEYEAADELWASAVGVRTELHHCRSLQPGADDHESGQEDVTDDHNNVKMNRRYYYKCTNCGREASYAGMSVEEIADDASTYKKTECLGDSEKVCNFELFKTV